MSGPRYPILAPLLAAVTLAASCRSYKDPESACEAFLSAVHQQDAAAVFDGLLLSTQWAFHTVAREQGRMRALIESDYPKAERGAALGRLLPEARDGRDLFRLLYPQRWARDFERRLGQGAKSVTVAPAGDAATCTRAGGQPFRFARAPSGRWGMSELNEEWDLVQVRAIHDLDTVRENARLYLMSRGSPHGGR